jgi:hypothetical protein
MAEVICPNCQTPHEPCPQIYVIIQSCSCGTLYWASDGQALTPAEIQEMVSLHVG